MLTERQTMSMRATLLIALQLAFAPATAAAQEARRTACKEPLASWRRSNGDVVCLAQRMIDFLACLEPSGGLQTVTDVESYDKGTGTSAAGKAEASGMLRVANANGSVTVDRTNVAKAAREIKKIWNADIVAACERLSWGAVRSRAAKSGKVPHGPSRAPDAARTSPTRPSPVAAEAGPPERTTTIGGPTTHTEGAPRSDPDPKALTPKGGNAENAIMTHTVGLSSPAGPSGRPEVTGPTQSPDTRPSTTAQHPRLAPGLMSLPQKQPPAHAESWWNTRRTVGLTTAVLGASGVAAAGVLYRHANAEYHRLARQCDLQASSSTCDPTVRPQVVAYNDSRYVGPLVLGIGVAAMVAGVALVAWPASGGAERGDHAAAVAHPVIGPSHLGIVASF